MLSQVKIENKGFLHVFELKLTPILYKTRSMHNKIAWKENKLTIQEDITS